MINTELSEADKLALLPKEQREAILSKLTPEQARDLMYRWEWWARPKQLRVFDDDWNTFLLLCGRGWGKSRTACQWVRKKALENPGCKIAVVGATAQIVNRTVVTGNGGIMDVCRPEEATYKRGDAKIVFNNGSTVFLYSAAEPKRLRGPNHHFALADDIVAWQYPEAYHMLKLTLRIGANPQMLVTTSAAATQLILDIISNNSEEDSEREKAVEEVNSTEFIKKEGLIILRGTTFENTHLPNVVLDDYKRSYPENSIMGQQELYAKIVLKVEGALWDRRWLQWLKRVDSEGEIIPEPTYIKTVVAVDPAVSANKNSDYTAIVVSSKDKNGKFYVRYARRFKTTPKTWAEEVLKVYHQFHADKIIAEANNGGLLVEETLRSQNSYAFEGKRYEVDGENLPIELIHAKQGKHVRATPVAFLYEDKRVYHAVSLGELEQQMLAFKGEPNGSDDLVDALVYTILDLSGAKLVTPQTPLIGGFRKTTRIQYL